MDLKFLFFFAVALLFITEIKAGFNYDPPVPTNDDLTERGLRCIPGRTILKVAEHIEPKSKMSSEEDQDNTRRSHMNQKTDDTSCQICVCSTEGKDQYCSNREARNVNECIRMATLKDRFQKLDPYNHGRLLSMMIRRDEIWHKDEIPYDAHAKCARAHSYYSNNPNADNTDIEVESDINDLLHYNSTLCFYCVCNTDGTNAQCINRDLFFCDYFRKLQEPESARDTYMNLFQQDRPTYFRTLSYRLRRTMDQGIFDLVESGGDALCCGHPDGHRRTIHNRVMNRIQQLKRKVPKENLLTGGPGGDYVDFVVNNDK